METKSNRLELFCVFEDEKSRRWILNACEHCKEDFAEFYCDICDQYLYVQCSDDKHFKGKAKLHTRVRLSPLNDDQKPVKILQYIWKWKSMIPPDDIEIP